MPTATQRLASFAAGLRAVDLPPDVASAARLHTLDVLGCGLAAHALGEARFATAAALEAGSEAGGPASAIGVPGGLAAEEAALLNGTLCHALDYDDTHPDSIVHVSASSVPAALAGAQAAGRDADVLLAAIVAADEVTIRVGMAAGGVFHARGLHPTGVCGAIGAAAAAARVRGLDAARTAHALGIAASMASGVLEFLADGAKTKPLHAGWAAHAGLVAARLAAHGATGPVTALEGRRGLLGAYLHGADHDLAGQAADLGARWETQRIAFKPYTACHYVHAPVDALAQLLAEEDVRAEDVERIVALSDTTGVGLTLHPLEDKLRPRTVYDAKFSLPYCLAARIVRGRLGVEDFTDAAVADPAVLALAARVTYEEKAYAAAPDAFPGGVRVTLRDGRVLEAELRHQRGGADNPMADEEIVGKWRANAALALEADAVARLEDAVLSLGSQAGGASSFGDLGAARAAAVG